MNRRIATIPARGNASRALAALALALTMCASSHAQLPRIPIPPILPPPPALTPPNAPTNLRVTAVSTCNTTLNWNDNSSNESSFEIWGRPRNGTWTLIRQVGANVRTTSFGGGDLPFTDRYEFKVRAVRIATHPFRIAFSSFSNIVAADRRCIF